MDNIDIEELEIVTKFQINFEKLEMLIINDLDGIFLPMFLIQLLVNPFLSEISKGSKSIEFNIDIEIQFFNAHISRFEPYFLNYKHIGTVRHPGYYDLKSQLIS